MGNRILVTRSSMPPMEEYFEEVAPLWESHWLTNMGVEHKKLEADLKERLGINNLALFTNGHNALECILEAMALPTGGEVITTPFTFASTTHAIVRKGLTPVFADVNPVNLTLDPESIERLITPRTCAIVPVHVYGNLCDVDVIQEIADRHGLKVIYDAAHAFGVERVNEDGSSDSAAAFGDASMFSFHATKVFNTIEGGCVCFKDEDLYPLLNQWKNFGITGPEDVEYVGGNAKMNEFCAAMGVCNLRHLDAEIEHLGQIDVHVLGGRRTNGADDLSSWCRRRIGIKDDGVLQVDRQHLFILQEVMQLFMRLIGESIYPSRKQQMLLNRQFLCLFYQLFCVHSDHIFHRIGHHLSCRAASCARSKIEIEGELSP